MIPRLGASVGAVGLLTQQMLSLRLPGSLAGACWARTEDPSGCGAASPSQGRNRGSLTMRTYLSNACSTSHCFHDVCPGPNIPLQGRQGSRGCIPGSPGESGLAQGTTTQESKCPWEEVRDRVTHCWTVGSADYQQGQRRCRGRPQGHGALGPVSSDQQDLESG